jgi:hypothetical protein
MAMAQDAASQGLIAGKADLDRLAGAAFAVAAGVMLALCAAALLWPPPDLVAGVHAMILDSQAPQLRVEPREKAFLALAVTLGFLAGLLAMALRRPRIALSRRTLALLALEVAVINVCCAPALNDEAGAGWALAGLAAALALGYAAVRASR